MQLIAQYPIADSAILPYCGRPIGAVLANGDVVCGILERVHEGNVVFRPIDGGSAQVAQIEKTMKSKLNSSKLPKHPKASVSQSKAQVNAWGAGFGYPYGWGYGNYGWGAGWWWIWPLFWLTALFALPFFWI